MKYTRYNVKPKKKQGSNLMFYLALTLLLALVLGTFVQKYFLQDGNSIWFKNQSQQSGESLDKSSGESEEGGSNSSSQDGSNVDTPVSENDKLQDNSGEVLGEQYKFYVMQCGVFKVQENANKVLETLKLYGRPFTDSQGELTKIYFGVFTEETYGLAEDILKGKGIDTSKVTITVPVEDLSTGQMCKIIDNLIQIMNKTYESGVKSINTADIKGWVSQLEEVNDTMKDYESVKDLKNYIQNLPEVVDKNSFEDGMKLIYDKVKAFK